MVAVPGTLGYAIGHVEERAVLFAVVVAEERGVVVRFNGV